MTADRIRELNDKLRTYQCGGRLMVTQGVVSKSTLPRILEIVRSYDDFSEDNDPRGEHDFGAFDHDGERYFWKIDYYDTDLRFASPDPADPTVTCRVLTVMLASEY